MRVAGTQGRFEVPSVYACSRFVNTLRPYGDIFAACLDRMTVTMPA
jgi:hypothetical protein